MIARRTPRHAATPTRPPGCARRARQCGRGRPRLRVLLPVVRHVVGRRLVPALVAGRPRAAERHRLVVLPRDRPLLVVRQARDRRADERDPRRRGSTRSPCRGGGRGSPEDLRMPAIVACGRASAASSSPPTSSRTAGRTVESIATDIAYLAGSVRDQDVLHLPSRSTSRRATGRTTIRCCIRCLTSPSTRRPRLPGAAAAARFDGVYTYDIVTYGGNTFHRLCAEAHAMHLLCAPSVGPGYNAKRGQRRPGRQAAQARADLRRDVACGDRRAARTTSRSRRSTSGTRERRSSRPSPGAARRYRYLSYDGAWGLHGAAAESAYLHADALLVGRLPQDAAGAAEDQGVVDRVLVDAPQLRVREVDRRVGPRFEAERGGAVGRAGREQRVERA